MVWQFSLTCSIVCVCIVSDKNNRPLWNYSSWYWGPFFLDTLRISHCAMCSNLQACWCFCIGRLQKEYQICIDTGDTFYVHSKKQWWWWFDDKSDIICVWQGMVTDDTIANLLLVCWWALHMNLISNGRCCHPQNGNCITCRSTARK